jgi:hypothetical protein
VLWRLAQSQDDAKAQKQIRKQKQIPFGNDNQKSKSNSVTKRAGPKATAWSKSNSIGDGAAKRARAKAAAWVDQRGIDLIRGWLRLV